MSTTDVPVAPTLDAAKLSEITDRRIPLALIYPHKRNYKRHPYKQLVGICGSLVRFGQVKGIVVQEGTQYAVEGDDAPDTAVTCCAGHGVWLSANLIASGQFAAPQERVEQLQALDCRVIPAHWSQLEVVAYLAADNLLAAGGEDDRVMLGEILVEQRDAGMELEALGSSSEDLDMMLEDLGDEWTNRHDHDGEGDGYTDDLEDNDEGDDSEAPAGAVRIFPDAHVVDVAFDYFRARGFPYRDLPIYISMQQINALANTPSERLLKTINGYHVADTYHPHRFHGHADGKKSPQEAFTEDKLLHRTLALFMEHDGKVPADILSTLSVVSGTQACSNFRPGFALYLYREFCEFEGATVLDTSTGYGGRLVGFFASGMANQGGTYIGIDPNVDTYEGNQRMTRDFGMEHAVELINLPAEDVPHEQVAERCDFAFTSPPYFSKEHYSEDETQSWKRYSSGNAWRLGFLRPMLALQYAALKPGRIAIINIADVTIGKKTYPLVDWTIDDAQSLGFEHVETREFRLQMRFGAHMPDEEASEPVIVLRKPL